jgi:tRNA(Ile)-lysidine synthase
VARGECLLLAVSGGGDSMGLLHASAWVSQRLGFRVVAHGVDHGLRADASLELDTAERLAAGLGVPFGRTRISVPEGGNLQARARVSRYAALGNAARAAGASAVATGHHADDRAETLLLRLLRGAGPAGLAVMPAQARLPSEVPEDAPLKLFRPMLSARRSEILVYLERHEVKFHEDPSNAKPRFLRSQVRHELMPLLERLSPSMVVHLNALATQLLAQEVALRDSRSPVHLTQFPGIEPLPGKRFSRAQIDALRKLPEREASASVRLPRALFREVAGSGALAARYDRAQAHYVLQSERLDSPP